MVTVENAFRIRATSGSTLEGARVLKDGELFTLSDRFGDIQAVGEGPQGLYLAGTRHLSRFALLVENEPPLLLSSRIRSDNGALVVDLTNPDTSGLSSDHLAADTIHIRRSRVLDGAVCWERATFRNHSTARLTTHVAFLFACDFRDVFEVRGTNRTRRGHVDPPDISEDSVTVTYHGLDEVARHTKLTFAPVPEALSGSRAEFTITLEPGESHDVEVAIACLVGQEEQPDESELGIHGYAGAVERVGQRAQQNFSRHCKITTSNEMFNAWVARAAWDIHLLGTLTEWGPYPYAGIPWFSCPFGRDGLIAAFQTLWAGPDLARGVLHYLAAHQAREPDATRDAEPGKILHERRLGEMAALREVPFALYYGSIDSTPLFVWLAAEYLKRSGDVAFLRNLWPAIERALGWIESKLDENPCGYLAYARASGDGLVHQGWKDSQNCVFHADGSDAQAPIALCEVQGYVYAALQGAAHIAHAIGVQTGEHLLQRAKELRERFDRDFWCDEIGSFALALDADAKPCRVLSSNAGQCLWTGIVRPERVQKLAESLLSPRSFSGYGIRTIAEGEPRYNPLSYHNGSVWPHDTSLVAAGLSRYGRHTSSLQIFRGLFAAAQAFDLQRLPEVFCGTPRTPGSGPTQYPVACSPQAWAAGSVFLLLQASLGLGIDALHRRIEFRDPVLPPFLEWVEIRNLTCGTASVNLRMTRHATDVGVEVMRRQGGPVRVVVEK